MCIRDRGVGDQTVITSSAIMIPIAILIAFIYPGNKFFPVAFFGSSLLYAMATICMVTKGNVFRAIICGMFYMIFCFFAFNITASLCTDVYKRQVKGWTRGFH